jgi:UDP-2,3-diacylglucosamine pyrophosphatase LpxH
MEMEFNGWTNRETWATKLHLDNDEALNEWAYEFARDWKETGEAVYTLGDTLKNWVEDDLLTLENVAGNRGLWLMLTDIGSLYRVNWREIAQAYADDMAQELENAL